MEYFEKVKEFFTGIINDINDFINDLFIEVLGDKEIEENRENETYYEYTKRKIIKLGKMILFCVIGVLFIIGYIMQPFLTLFEVLLSLILCIISIPLACVMGVIYFVYSLLNYVYQNTRKCYRDLY